MTPTNPSISGEALKPCPFCGCADSSVAAPDYEPDESVGSAERQVCWGVGCSCTAYVGPWETKAAAIAAWNTRSPASVGWQPHLDYAGEPMPEGKFRDPPECAPPSEWIKLADTFERMGGMLGAKMVARQIRELTTGIEGPRPSHDYDYLLTPAGACSHNWIRVSLSSWREAPYLRCPKCGGVQEITSPRPRSTGGG